ncbi:MAG: sulfite exporter TauE/SafE family protein [Candidatus Competibacteraceae bacterium]
MMVQWLENGQLIAPVLAVVMGGLVHGALGVGFPLVVTPLIALVTDVKTAILLTLIPTLTVNVFSVLYGGRWSESIGLYWSVALFTLLGSILGTTLLIVSNPAPFKLVLAVLILFYLYADSLATLDWSWIQRHSRPAGIGFGAVAGVAAGTVNVAVPVLIIYFTELRLAPTALVQILNLCFMAGKAAQVATFSVSGHLTVDLVLISGGLALLAGLSLWVGMRLRQRLDVDTYQGWLRRVLLIVAGTLIVQFAVDFIS